MFGPNTAQSIEMSAKLRRAETEQWAANERLVRSVRKHEPSWIARQVAGLLGIIRGRRATVPALSGRTPTTPAVVLSVRPVEPACEDELFDSSGSGLMAA